MHLCFFHALEKWKKEERAQRLATQSLPFIVRQRLERVVRNALVDTAIELQLQITSVRPHVGELRRWGHDEK
jgi:hypothetical protein